MFHYHEMCFKILISISNYYINNKLGLIHLKQSEHLDFEKDALIVS